MRIQGVMGLSNSESGWYGYEGSHLKYDEIGDGIGWQVPNALLNESQLNYSKILD